MLREIANGFLIFLISFQLCSAQQKKGTITVKRSTEFTIKAINSESNTLYRSINNPIEVVIDIPTEQIVLECSDGSIIWDGNRFLVKPGKENKLTISVGKKTNQVNKDYDTTYNDYVISKIVDAPDEIKPIGSALLNVRDIEKPYLVLAGKIKGPISMTEIRSSYELGISTGTCDYKYNGGNLTIAQFTVKVEKEGRNFEEKSDSSKLTQKQMNLLSEIPVKGVFYLTDIVLNVAGGAELKLEDAKFMMM